MSGVLQVLFLAVLAVLATFLLDRGGRTGYGWVTGSEFLIAGMVVGPAGLDLLGIDLLEAVRPVMVLATAWLGFRFGLRLRPSELRPLSGRVIAASLLEPTLALLVLGALLELARALFGLPATPGLTWALAAVGSATTKSAVAWARGRHGAQGPLTDALAALSSLDDVVAVLAVVLLLGVVSPPPLAWRGLWVAPLATLLLGLFLAVLLRLLIESGPLKPDLAWVALLGVITLGSGLAARLELSPLSVLAVAGAGAGWLSPHADAFEEITRGTERPAVQVLLVLGGAGAPLTVEAWGVAALFVLVRLVAKVLGGAGASALLEGPARVRRLGGGLWAFGGVAFALALALSLRLGREEGGPLLAGACAAVVLGDVLGSPALKALLRRASELGVGTIAPTPPGPMPALPPQAPEGRA